MSLNFIIFIKKLLYGVIQLRFQLLIKNPVLLTFKNLFVIII